MVKVIQRFKANIKVREMSSRSLVFWKLLLYWDLDVKPGWSQKREKYPASGGSACINAWSMPAVS